MNKGVFASKYNFGVKNLRCETAAVPIATSFKRRVYSHVSLFRRKFWASKVMYRGSVADVLALQGLCANPGIPPQMPQRVDCTDLVDLFRLSSM